MTPVLSSFSTNAGTPHGESFSTSPLLIFEVTLLIVSVGWSYDVWSVFQGRLLFPCYFAVLIALNAGMEWTESSRLRALCTRSSLLSLVFLFLAYFVVEFWLTGIYPANPLSMDHMPYKIDMNAP